jgi:hypothetical protein
METSKPEEEVIELSDDPGISGNLILGRNFSECNLKHFLNLINYSQLYFFKICNFFFQPHKFIIKFVLRNVKHFDDSSLV